MKKTYKDTIETKEWITNALIILMQEEAFDKIKITDIAKKSGVSRATFYRLYNDKEEVLEQYCEYLTQLYSYKIKNNCDNNLKVLCETLKEHSDFLVTLITHHKDYLIFNTVYQNLKQMAHSSINDYIISQYISGGITCVVINWIKEGFKISIDDLCVTISTLIDGKSNNIADIYKQTFSKI